MFWNQLGNNSLNAICMWNARAVTYPLCSILLFLTTLWNCARGVGLLLIRKTIIQAAIYPSLIIMLTYCKILNKLLEFIPCVFSKISTQMAITLKKSNFIG